MGCVKSSEKIHLENNFLKSEHFGNDTSSNVRFSHSRKCDRPKSKKSGKNMWDSLAFFEYCQVNNHLTYKDNVSLGLTSTGCRDFFLKFCETVHSRFKFFRKKEHCLSTSQYGPTYTNDGNLIYFHPFHNDPFDYIKRLYHDEANTTLKIFSVDRETTNVGFLNRERNLGFASNYFFLGLGQLTKEERYIHIALDRSDWGSLYTIPVDGLKVELISESEGQLEVEEINFPVVIPAEVLLELETQNHIFSISPGGHVVAWILELAVSRRISNGWTLEFVPSRISTDPPQKLCRGCFYHANIGKFVHFWLPSFDKVRVSSSCFSASGELFAAITYPHCGKLSAREYQPAERKRAQNAAIQIWNTVSGTLIQNIQLQNSIEIKSVEGLVEYFYTFDYSISPDGEIIVCAPGTAPSYRSYEHQLKETLIYDVKSGNLLNQSTPQQQPPPFHNNTLGYNLTSFDICSSGRALLKLYDVYGNTFGSSGKCLILEDLRTGQVISEHYLMGEKNKYNYNHIKCSPTNDADFFLAYVPSRAPLQSFADIYKWAGSKMRTEDVDQNHEWMSYSGSEASAIRVNFRSFG